MVAFGVLCMLVPVGAGSYVAWQNRHSMVQAHVGNVVWTGHLWGVLVVGALLACWFLLGAAFIQCRIAERRKARATTSDAGRPAAAGEVAAGAQPPSGRRLARPRGALSQR